MELLTESGLVKPDRLTALKKEAEEILAITVSSIKTSRSKNPKRTTKPARPN